MSEPVAPLPPAVAPSGFGAQRHVLRYPDHRPEPQGWGPDPSGAGEPPSGGPPPFGRNMPEQGHTLRQLQQTPDLGSKGQRQVLHATISLEIAALRFVVMDCSRDGGFARRLIFGMNLVIQTGGFNT